MVHFYIRVSALVSLELLCRSYLFVESHYPARVRSLDQHHWLSIRSLKVLDALEADMSLPMELDLNIFLATSQAAVLIDRRYGMFWIKLWLRDVLEINLLGLVIVISVTFSAKIRIDFLMQLSLKSLMLMITMREQRFL